MINIRPVLLVIGLLTTALGIAMLAPLIADLVQAESTRRDDWHAFAASGLFALLFGITTATATWGPIEQINVRQGFLITTLSWLFLVFFAALPFYFGNYDLSFNDAFFEAMSGLTTTGSTVINGLDQAPSGLLLWRSMLQWIGGIGIVIMAVAILPMLSIGGMQLFRIEPPTTSDQVMAGTSQIAGAITVLYIAITSVCFLTYWFMGMSAFDAINHAMTTIATGGFSTHDLSFGHFLTDPNIRGPIDLVATLFMILGSLPFVLYLLYLRGDRDALINDSQSRFFLFLVTVFVVVIMLRIFHDYQYDLFTAFRLAAFNVVSVITGTGYATSDYWLWGPFTHGFFFCLMFIGGCAGSTSCGLKIFRLQVVFAALSVYGRRLVFPNGVFVARYNGRPLTDDVFISVLSFFFVYFAVFATVAVILTSFNLEPFTALSAAGTAIANVGPGLGEIVGPAGNFSSLPDGAKWTLSLAMFLGRLEFFAVFVLLAPSFWRE